MVLDTAAPTNTIQISHYLDDDCIHFLDATTRDDALLKLSNILYGAGKVENIEEFNQAIIEREKIVSTGIGMGIAIPHAKMKNLSDFFICVGISQNNGIDWSSLDNLPVHMIFMIGGPANQQSEYLAILSALTKLIRSKEFRFQLLRCNSNKEIIHLIKSQELTLLQNA